MSETVVCTAEVSRYDYDVIIVGSGAAGLFTALNADSHLEVLLISKKEFVESSSQLAQGGIAAAMVAEDIPSHIEDTLRVGCYKNNVTAVEEMVKEGHQVIDDLEALGVQFDRDATGALHATREGGHSAHRIMHHTDNTGAELIRALTQVACKRDNITCKEHTTVLDLYIQGEACRGVLLVDSTKKVKIVTAPQVVLATGGIGELYINTTNSSISTGDGIAIAHRAGVQIVDMEFVQFHPTAFYDADSNRRFLISEAVRGEGAYLRNETGERFMEAFPPLMELSARDIVAREIYFQIQKSTKPCVYLDLRHLDPTYITKRFPNIYAKCLEEGFDFVKDLIPVSPVQHYIMGGIATDHRGQTSLSGLFACGEVASTGVHGANRLASNSLLEALVYGKRIGHHLISRRTTAALDPTQLTLHFTRDDLPEAKVAIKGIMSECAFIFRTEALLLKGQRELKLWVKRLETLNTIDFETHEVYNMAQVGLLIVESALARKISLGAHKRLDDGGDL